LFRVLRRRRLKVSGGGGFGCGIADNPEGEVAMSGIDLLW
jgi:hypothetical protein